MKKNKLFLFCIWILFFFNSSFATTYYISNSGNDNNNGLSPVFPWNSINKLNSNMKLLMPGDSVLFERNSFFAGQIYPKVSGNDQLPIIFAAYGEGRHPVISGSVPLKNWYEYKSNIYMTDVNFSVKNLFVDREQMIIARYPNTGFLSVESELQNSKTGFMDNSLSQPKDFWNDANVRIRSSSWTYEYTPVKSFENGMILFSNPTIHPANKGWGYYLDNKLSILDAQKEWFYDDLGNSKGVVYLFPPANLNPNTAYIEGSIYPNGIFSNQNISNITIRDLKFINQYDFGILLSGNSKSNIKIENCTFSGQIKGGVAILNPSNNCEIVNCRFYNINGKAIYFLKAENSKISGNVFKNTGLIPGYGTTSDDFGNSSVVVLSSNSNIINYNYILNTGHDGINCIGSSNIIEKNVILNSMLVLNDGGAVKSYGNVNTNTIFRNNYISNVIGNSEGTSGPYSRIVVTGIYLDEECSDMKVLNNTISGSNQYGIFLYNKCNSNLISENVCYNNQTGINFFNTAEPMINNVTSYNVFVSTLADQVSVMLKSFSGTFVPGKFEGNYYINPLSGSLFLFQSKEAKNLLNFNQWKKLIGENNEISSEVLTGNEVLYSKIYSNLSDDTLKEILTPGIKYKDIDLNNIYDSFSLPPWTSKVVFVDVNVSENSEILHCGSPLVFGSTESDYEPDVLWFGVTAKNLISPVKVTAPGGFLVSMEEDLNYSKELIIYPVNKNINTVVFVKFIPDTNELYNEFISIESGNLIEKLKVTGKN